MQLPKVPVSKFAAHLVTVLALELVIKTKLLAVSKAMANGSESPVAPALLQLVRVGGEPAVYVQRVTVPVAMFVI